MDKCCWLNIANGEFSNTFDCKEITADDINYADEQRHYKLIKFECLNDSDFTFDFNMQIVTKPRRK